MKKFLFILILVFAINSIGFSQGAGYLLNFGGTDEYVTMGQNNTNLQITGDLTIEVWVNVAALPTSPYVYTFVCYGDNGESVETNILYALYLHSDGTIRIRHEDASSNDFYVTSTNTLPLNQWVHIAIVRTTSTSTYQIYFNGVLDNSGTYSGAPSGGSGGYTILAAGFYATGTTGVPNSYMYLTGEMEEVRIWNTALNASTIQAWMNKKVTTSHPNYSNLQGYWRLDDGSGTTATDEATNGYDGTLMNMESADWQISQAPLGDDAVYSVTASDLNLASSQGDDITVQNIVGSPSFVALIRNDEAPNYSGISTGLNHVDPLRYWEVWMDGGTSYDVVYNYEGHSGIDNETNLRLGLRSNAATTTWGDASATLNETANTLTLTGQSADQQLILASAGTDNPLPVELISFSAVSIEDGIKLRWETASEEDNIGFEIHRTLDENDTYQLIADYKYTPELKGAGTTSQGKTYSFTDKQVANGNTYYYKLYDVSTNGIKTEYGPIMIVYNGQTIDNDGGLTIEKFELSQNYPNPFNPETIINFSVPESPKNPQQVRIDIFDINGRFVKNIFNDKLSAGYYHTKWDGKDSFNSPVNSGVYIYRMKGGIYTFTRRMLLIH